MLSPCGSCHRHIHADEARCPFCGEALHTTPARSSALLSLAMAGALTLVGCGDKNQPGDDDAGVTSNMTTADTGSDNGSENGTVDTSDTSTMTTDGSSTTSTDNTSGSFYAGPAPDTPMVSVCDNFAQDCPEGEKCVPYSNDGGSAWNANKCVPVTGNGEPGDECIWDGIVEATDDCGADSICWDVMDVDGVNVGVCTQFCAGSPDDPMCPSNTACLIANDGTINVCVATCDPLLQDCPEGLGCFWAVDAFQCIFTAGELPTSDPCGYINDCAPGNLCVDAANLPSCDGSACCASFCSLADPMCPIMGTECVAFFEMGMAPPGYEDIGTCILPG